MEPHRPDAPEVELLESRPPGAFERATASLLRRRWVRLAGGAAIALVLGTGAWSELAGDDPVPATPPDPQDVAESVPRDPVDYVPPPWVTSGLAGWEVLGRPEVNPESATYVVTFRAVNRSDDAQNPRNFVAVGSFAGDPGFRFTASCTGFDNDAAGVLRPVRSMVEPGEMIRVRCPDAMEYSGNRPELDPRSLEIRAISP